MRFTILKYDIRIALSSLHDWSHFKIHNRWSKNASWHLVWGKLSLLIEDHTAEVYAICAECDSPDIGEQWCGDEGLTVCESCRSIEQGYKYINKRQYEAL